MPETISVAQAGLPQADLLAALMEASFPPDFGERWRPEDMAITLDMAGVTAFVAHAGADPVGFALLRVVVDEAELLLVGVLPACRREGIGRRLLQAVQQAASAGGARWLFLEMRAGNAAARALYEQDGFVCVGGRPGYYRTGSHVEDAVTMRKQLNGCQAPK